MPKSANPHRRSLSSILGFRAKSAPSTPTSECHQLPDMSKKSFKLHRKLTKRGSRAPPPPPPPRDINVSSLSLAKAGPYFGCNGSDQSTLEIRHRDQPKGHTFGTDDDPESDQASPLPVVESLNHANSYDFNHDLEAGHSRARSFDPTLSTQSSFPVSPTVSGGNISPGLEDHSPGGVRDNFVRLFPESESTEQSAESTDDSEDAVMFRSKRLHVERTARQMKRVVAIINIPNPEDYLKAMIAFKQEGLPVDEAAPEVSEVEKAQLLIIRELIFIEMKYESQLARLSKVSPSCSYVIKSLKKNLQRQGCQRA